MSAKNSNHGTNANNLTNKVLSYADIKRTISWRERGISKKVAQVMAEELFEWSQKDNALSLGQFCLERGMTTGVLRKLCKAHEDLEYVYELTKQAIGVRREEMAISKNGDGTVLIKTMHLYHPEWAEMVEQERQFKRELRREEKLQPTQITVVMEDYSREKPHKQQAHTKSKSAAIAEADTNTLIKHIINNTKKKCG